MTAEIAAAWEVHPWTWEVAVALDDHRVDQVVQGYHWEVHQVDQLAVVEEESDHWKKLEVAQAFEA